MKNSSGQRIHFVGICGTFMGGLARLAASCGHEVSGSDAAFYEPMASQLEHAGIAAQHGYDEDCKSRPADIYVVGNVARRGMPLVESIIASGIPFVSAPAWAAANLLAGRTVAAVAGTHGKTTTASLLVHLLDRAGLNPSYLLGGVHAPSGYSAQLDSGDLFVIEADEYDAAFFDKRPKFAHYWSQLAIVNNVEFDHADIYRDFDEVKIQFARLGRTVMPGGTMLANADCEHSMIAASQAAAWCGIESFNDPQGWHFRSDNTFWLGEQLMCSQCNLPPGQHNRANAAAAAAAAVKLGADPAGLPAAFADYILPARRLEQVANGGGAVLIDDFAHHPTAIAATLAAVRETYPSMRIVALLELRSNTMRAGYWQGRLAASLSKADAVYALGADLEWDLDAELADTGKAYASADEFAAAALAEIGQGDIAVMLSNGDFGGMRQHLAKSINARAANVA